MEVSVLAGIDVYGTDRFDAAELRAAFPDLFDRFAALMVAQDMETLEPMLNELKDFRQKDDLNPIMFFIPILGIIEMWKLPQKVLEAKQMAGVINPSAPNPILYLLLGIYFIPADLNEIWQAAGGQRA